jgi:REP element-mobilizing transposase RayT
MMEDRPTMVCKRRRFHYARREATALQTPDALPSPILRRLPRRRSAVPRLAARRLGTQPLPAGAADIAGGRREDAQGCVQGCAPEGLTIKYRLKYLYVPRPMARLPRIDLPVTPSTSTDLKRAALQRDCAVYAYVLMTNHVHLLVSGAETGCISAMMQSLGRRYVRAINQRYGRSGTLWEGRFKIACD